MMRSYKAMSSLNSFFTKLLSELEKANSHVVVHSQLARAPRQDGALPIFFKKEVDTPDLYIIMMHIIIFIKVDIG